jgi:hypothetical protein
MVQVGEQVTVYPFNAPAWAKLVGADQLSEIEVAV